MIEELYEGYNVTYDKQARLIILKSLKGQTNGTLNSAMIETELQSWGVDRGRAYVHTQLLFLANDVGAIEVKERGSFLIATLRQAGLDHVEKRRVLPDVQPPSFGA